MGRINNANWVNQHRKIQGKFHNKQDIEAYLFDNNLSNGNNIQEKNRLNTDDLPNIPAILDYEQNLSIQSIIEPIDGGKAHTPNTQVFLTALTAFTALSPNITVSSKQAISADSQNSLSRMVKSSTEMNNPPILFDTTSATTPTSQNHDKLEEPIKHQENQSFIRIKRQFRDKYTIYDNKLLISNTNINTEKIKQILKENSNINVLQLCHVLNIDSQTAHDLATILKNSNINVLQLSFGALSESKPDVFKPLSVIDFKYVQQIVKVLHDTNIEQLIFSNNRMGGKRVINIIKSLKEVDSKVKILDLTNNGISNKGAEDIAYELRGTKIIEVQLYKNPIKFETLQKISMVLEDNRHVNEDSYTSTMESSSTKEESSKDISGKQEKKEYLTTPKGNIIEKLEPIAEDSTTPTPQESNPNNPTSSTISINALSVGLTALAVSIIGAIGGTTVYVIKKFCDEKKSYTHDALALAEPISDSHLDNNKDIPLTGGVLVNNEADI